MEEPIIITSRGEVRQRPKPGGVRRSLPYQGIARRPLDSKLIYNREIDISAVIIK